MNKDELTKVSINMKKDLKDKLKNIAGENFRDLSGQINFIISEYIKEYEKKIEKD